MGIAQFFVFGVPVSAGRMEECSFGSGKAAKENDLKRRK